MVERIANIRLTMQGTLRKKMIKRIRLRKKVKIKEDSGFLGSISFLSFTHKTVKIRRFIYATVQPLIYYIRKPASKLSVAAMQLVFTSFHKWKAIQPQKTSQ